jgi:S1-C subfamily serine protease
MHARQINWTLVATIFLVGFASGMVPAASGQSHQEIVHEKDCANARNTSINASNHQKWDLLVYSARQYISNCRDLFQDGDEALFLDEIGLGLDSQKKFEDAFLVLARCVKIKPDYAPCFAEMGDALVGLGDLVSARSAYERALAISVSNNRYGELSNFARQRLADLPSEVETPQPAGLGGGGTPTATETKKFGTGFVVSAEGHILTNNHVVAGCRTLTTRDGHPLEVLSRNGDSDLALLRQPKGNHNESTSVPVAVFRTGPAPELGDVVVAFGFPLPGVLSSEGNVSTGILSATSGLGNDVRFIQISAPVQPGNSGGPLFDSSGHVIGVVVAKLDAVKIAEITGDIPQNVNFAVQWAAVRAFLDEAKIPYRTEVSLHATPTRNIAAAAERIAVTIECTE